MRDVGGVRIRSVSEDSLGHESADSRIAASSETILHIASATGLCSDQRRCLMRSESRASRWSWSCTSHNPSPTDLTTLHRPRPPPSTHDASHRRLERGLRQCVAPHPTSNRTRHPRRTRRGQEGHGGTDGAHAILWRRDEQSRDAAAFWSISNCRRLGPDQARSSLAMLYACRYPR